MFIAIASTGKDLTSLIAESFGRSEYFIIYNTKENNYKVLRNPFSGLLDGAGIQTAQFIIEANASAVITKDIGMKSMKTLKSADVRIFICRNSIAREVIKDYLNGYVTEIGELPPKYPLKTVKENIN